MSTPAKYLITVCIYISLFASAKAQSTYTEAIQQGDAAFKAGQYKTAINKYFAAEAFEPARKEEVKIKVNLVFDRIEKLKNEAEKARREADSAKSRAVYNAAQKDIALNKASKLIKTFYFYNHRFALAYKSTGVNRAGDKLFAFYYIDQNGDELENLGQWDEAGPFKEAGFAHVKRDEGEEKPTPYLLDTGGHAYHAAYEVRDLDSSVEALDLSAVHYTDSLKPVMEQPQLKVFILNGSYFRHKYLFNIPPAIGNLKNLENLQMSFCSIDTFPPVIGQLEMLRVLNLEHNNFNSLPRSIGKLKNLIYLNLSNDSLTALPPEFGNMTALEEIDLSGNYLESLPPETGYLGHLKILNLSGNKLESLPPTMSKLKNLRVLNLRLNPVPKEQLKIIRAMLPKCDIIF